MVHAAYGRRVAASRSAFFSAWADARAGPHSWSVLADAAKGYRTIAAGHSRDRERNIGTSTVILIG